MSILGWRVHFTRRQLMMPRMPRPTLHSSPTDVIAGWLVENQGLRQQLEQAMRASDRRLRQ
jgi:hypothetical protein